MKTTTTRWSSKTAALVTFLALTLFASSSFAQNVTVNPGAGSYPTLKDAFDAIKRRHAHRGSHCISH